MLYSLFHANQSHSTGLGGIKSFTLILNREEQPIGFLLHHNANGLRLGVAGSIVQGFLDHSVYASLVFFGQFVGNVIGCHVYADTCLPRSPTSTRP